MKIISAFFALCFGLAMPCNAAIQNLATDHFKVEPATLQKYVGQYEVKASKVIITVTMENGYLWAKPSYAERVKLIPKSNNEFEARIQVEEKGFDLQLDELEVKVTFMRNAKGEVFGMSLKSQGPNFIARRVGFVGESTEPNVVLKLRGFPEAKQIAVAGTFNQWNASQLFFTREGELWTCRFDLPGGQYVYRLVVDGKWMLDPDNPIAQPDGHGSSNSVLLVKVK